MSEEQILSGYVVLRIENGWMDDNGLNLIPSLELAKESLEEHLQARREQFQDNPLFFHDSWLDWEDDWKSVDHWYETMRDRIQSGLSISLDQDTHVYIKPVFAKRETKRTERRRIGYVRFFVHGGIVQTDEVDLIHDRETVLRSAIEEVEKERLKDRYAKNMKQNEPAKETAEEYENRFDDARNLRNVGLNEKDDLIVLEVYDDVEIPDDEPGTASS